MTRAKRARAFLLVASAGWLLAMSLACGGSGDDDTSESAASGAAAEPAAPPPPTDPFERAGATVLQLADQLEQLAQRSPNGFANNNSMDTRSLTESTVRNAPDRSYVAFSLGFSPGLGQNGQHVSISLRRFADGRVRITNLTVGDSTAGSAAFDAPPPVQEIAQLLRLRIMDGNCELPVMTEPELAGEFPFIQRDARAVAENCLQARTAFNATSLSLSGALLTSMYDASMSGHLTVLAAQLASGSELRFDQAQFGLRR